MLCDGGFGVEMETAEEEMWVFEDLNLWGEERLGELDWMRREV